MTRDIETILKKADFAKESNHMSLLFFNLFGKPLEKETAKQTSPRCLCDENLAMVNGGLNIRQEEFPPRVKSGKNDPGGNEEIFKSSVFPKNHN